MNEVRWMESTVDKRNKNPHKQSQQKVQYTSAHFIKKHTSTHDTVNVQYRFMYSSSENVSTLHDCWQSRQNKRKNHFHLLHFLTLYILQCIFIDKQIDRQTDRQPTGGFRTSAIVSKALPLFPSFGMPARQAYLYFYLSLHRINSFVCFLYLRA